MKTIRIAALLMIIGLSACNSGGEGSSSEDTTGPNITGVENVNGNMPDTTNSITLDAGDTTKSDQSNTPH